MINNDPVANNLLVFKDFRVEEILREKKKKTNIPTTAVREDDTVVAAIIKMNDRNIGAAVVENQEGELSGIFTERHLMRALALHGSTVLEMPVHRLMTKQAICVNTDNTVIECMSIMSNRHVRHLPVCDKQSQELLGMISIGDLVLSIAREYRQAMDFFREYIQGTYSGSPATEGDLLKEEADFLHGRK